MAILLAVACLLLLLRLELAQWGFLLDRYERAALRRVLILHAAAFGVVGVALARVRAIRKCPALWPKIALGAMPLLVAVSCDRIATIHHPPVRYEPRLFAHHPRRGWTLNPGWSGLDLGTPVEVNRQGFRGPEVPLQKSEHEYRLMLLGDSIAFGFRLPDEVALAANLRRGCLPADPRKRLTIVNASVRAYSPWQEYDLLVHDGLPYNPDVIVHVFCLNDVLEKFELIRFGGWTLGQEPPRPAPLEWSGLYRLTRDWRHELLRPSKKQLRQWQYSISIRRLLAKPDAAKVRDGWDMAFEYLDKCIAAARERSIPFVIVCAPVLSQLVPESAFPAPSPQNVLRDFAEKRGVPYLDLLPMLDEHIRATGIEPWDLYIDEIHFSPDGYVVVADTLCRFLRDHDLLGN
jgi:hypothetical protein